MSSRIFRQALTVAAVSLVAAGAPFAAGAQTPYRPQPPQQQQQHGQPPYGQPSHSQPSHGQQHGPQHNQPSYQEGRYRIVATVNLRSGPGTNYRRVGQLRAGRTVQVDQVRNGWLHIRNQGWISAQYARRA